MFCQEADTGIFPIQTWGDFEQQFRLHFFPANAEADAVTPQMNFPWKITFDMLYTNEFLIRVRSRTLSISSEHTTI